MGVSSHEKEDRVFKKNQDLSSPASILSFLKFTGIKFVAIIKPSF